MSGRCKAKQSQCTATLRSMEEARGKEFWKTVRLALFLGLIAAGGWFFFIKPAQVAGNAASKALDGVLEKITGQKTTITEGTATVMDAADVAELALVKLKMSTVRSIETQKYFSIVSLGTKKLQVRGTFTVTAGYDLKEGGELKLNSDGTAAIASFPKARILSVELLELETLDEQDGWANKLTSEDRDQIIKLLRIQMKQEAQRSGIVELSHSYLETRLKDLLGVQEVQMERLP